MTELLSSNADVVKGVRLKQKVGGGGWRRVAEVDLEMLSSLGRSGELVQHWSGGGRKGMSPAQVSEALHQIAKTALDAYQGRKGKPAKSAHYEVQLLDGDGKPIGRRYAFEQRRDTRDDAPAPAGLVESSPGVGLMETHLRTTLGHVDQVMQRNLQMTDKVIMVLDKVTGAMDTLQELQVRQLSAHEQTCKALVSAKEMELQAALEAAKAQYAERSFWETESGQLLAAQLGMGVEKILANLDQLPELLKFIRSAMS